MSEIDVSQLQDESLQSGEFPAGGQSDFRVHFASEVHSDISDHAGDDTSVEICGVLVGGWLQDDEGPFVLIRHSIRCDTAASKSAEVTFTHESWAQINEEMDSKYDDQRIIGWYHSHPDFGIFLSDRDMFIQQHFFSAPGQVAYVVDPVRELEGIFEWRQGRAEVAGHYWVGDRIVTSAASASSPPAAGSMRPSGTGEGGTPADAESSSRTEPPLLPSPTVMLACVGLFLLGFLVSTWSSSSKERQLFEGAIVHYGLWNVMQIGRAEQVEDTRQRVELAFAGVSELSREHALLVAEDQREKLRKRWRVVRKQLADSRDTLKLIEQKYSVPKEQRPLLAKVIMAKISELQRTGVRGPVLPVPVPVPMQLLKPDDKQATPQPEQKPEKKPQKQKSADTTDSTPSKTKTP